jgi:uncharacterized Tic20 family protein
MVNPPDKTSSTATQENLWPMLSHLSALAGLIIPFGNIIGPLVVWLVKKDEMPIVNEYGKESLNFQISATLYMIGLGIVATILSFIAIGFLLFPLIGLAGLADLVLVIIASVQANKGIAYHYPVTIRFIK